MAAIRYTIEAIAEAGSNIVSISQLYGGTYNNLFAHTFPRQGIETRFAHADDFDKVASLIDEHTKAQQSIQMSLVPLIRSPAYPIVPGMALVLISMHGLT